MSLIKKYLSSPTKTSSFPWHRNSSGREPQPVVHSANFIDLSIEDSINSGRLLDIHNMQCMPTIRLPESVGRRSITRLRPVSSETQSPPTHTRGISWQDVHEWADDSNIAVVESCKHCNMRVAPAASRAWHERMCALNCEPVPESCELCQRPFVSLLHARNHYLYGCTPM
ncbi:hypothetical protein BX661DRAFT_224037 [Kickxella alabastrina]|uniref:uncharacterized protein n=1 Tax=Kickxella alabastrina TaxID=61397 RepID=UPI00221FF733|nr:uncharacterized protein BX661DRAFT_224037 [Kickxella alabastrina]KAI7830154.1 hypothetical protein BX661DRAFT_224037 [Kickxella alabastrina]